MKGNRFSIHGLKIADALGDPVPEIYIRELLDMPSHEFQTSKLSSQQKLEIIEEIGLEKLVPVLQDCFNLAGKGYVAEDEAKLALLVLSKER